MKRYFWIFILLFNQVLFVSCQGQHAGDNDTMSSSDSTAVSTASLEAFSQTMYAFGQTQGCVMCHASDVNPQWMNPDINAAYGFAKNLVDFSNPTASVFATFVGNNHCSNVICANPANDAVVQSLLAQWAAIEVQQGSSISNGATLANPPFVTQTMPIPSPLPLLTSNAPTVIRFDLSQLTPNVPALNGAILEVSILAYNTAQNEYKVYNPRIIGNAAPVSVSSIHVYVRPATGSGLGSEDVNQGDLCAAVKTTAAIAALPNPLPVGPIKTAIPLVNFALGITAQSAADVITIGFASIQ
jgi:hypothetical protein